MDFVRRLVENSPKEAAGKPGKAKVWGDRSADEPTAAEAPCSTDPEMTKAARRPQVGTLSVVEGDHEGQIFPLLEGENRIGRSPDSEVVLESRFVSRLHAKLLCKHGKLSFVPVSNQLTLVNGSVATETEVSDGDTIRLGRTTLLLRTES